jgi:hypothetical protein
VRSQLVEPALGPCEMLGFLARRAIEPAALIRDSRSQRLARVERLCADLARVIHAHQRRRVRLLRVGERWDSRFSAG